MLVKIIKNVTLTYRDLTTATIDSNVVLAALNNNGVIPEGLSLIQHIPRPSSEENVDVFLALMDNPTDMLHPWLIRGVVVDGRPEIRTVERLRPEAAAPLLIGNHHSLTTLTLNNLLLIYQTEREMGSLGNDISLNIVDRPYIPVTMDLDNDWQALCENLYSFHAFADNTDDFINEMRIYLQTTATYHQFLEAQRQFLAAWDQRVEEVAVRESLFTGNRFNRQWGGAGASPYALESFDALYREYQTIAPLINWLVEERTNQRDAYLWR